MGMYIMNASGRLINPFDLKKEDFDPRVIAQTLSRICRFWAQTSEFYSVAQHCLVMESLFEDPVLKKWALAHEIFEGLTGMDIPTPIKRQPYMASWREAEEKAIEKFASIHNLPYPVPPQIKEADKRLLVTEALRFMNSVNYDWEKQVGYSPYPLSIIGRPLEMKEAEIAFLTRWYELFSPCF